MPVISVQTPDFGVPKQKQAEVLQSAVRQHVESFNFFLNTGVNRVVENLQPLEISLPNGDRLKFEIRSCRILEPRIKRGAKANVSEVYPAECRGRQVTYRGDCLITLSWGRNGKVEEMIEKVIGEIPIMVKSEKCNLLKLNPKMLVKHGEEENEMGGYFIINGLEKVVRLLIAQRRNYPIAMQRNSWKKRGDLFTDFGVSVRSVSKDQSGSNMVLHYLSDGTAKLMFTYKRELYLVPIMILLKAMVDETDCYIYQQLIKGKGKDTFYQECIKTMLRKTASSGIYFQDQALEYLGEKFSVKLNLPHWYNHVECAKFLIKNSICVHLDKPKEKFNFLVFMVQKLFATVKNECALETPDNLMNQEVMTPGHLFCIVFKEGLLSWLNFLRMSIEKKMRSTGSDLTPAAIRQCLSKTYDMTRSMNNVLSTGNFVPRFENTLQQDSGLAIVGDKLNFWRYLSHFRAVHRGAFFAQMRTTGARKLLPEAWGFLCPVHTPDGTPCGLLNHMSAACQVVNEAEPDPSLMLNILYKCGVVPLEDPMPDSASFYQVQCDGRIVGWVLDKLADSLVNKLRLMKVKSLNKVPRHVEVCFVPKTSHPSQYPGIFIFTTSARMVRPVRNLAYGGEELIGTFEQVCMHVALTDADVIQGVTHHQEINSTNMLSILANQIPFSDYNQSPRNMYECQMGKQTMGTPCHSLRYRSDNKLYHIRTPQSPLVRPAAYDTYHMDEYPIGTNAIVAVISYTGYDMEDAIILNKSSMERGFKHGSIYKTESVNLRVITGEKGPSKAHVFGRGSDVQDNVAAFVDADGLPHIGTRLKQGDPYYCYIETATGKTTTMKYKSSEEAYVQDVKLLGNDLGEDTNQHMSVTYRVPRNPVIGDKFASRHGQKGICSLMLPVEDMPFTESGMTPDLIFNPHGFPSRMTIGMMIESMAGKSAAFSGRTHDCTPFTYSEKDTAIEYFAECLKNAGFDYYGTERMYSGVSGEELEMDIFFGVIYYQRLRHMVSDKFQVRTTGPIDPLTRQPIKGRKRDGGVRFGEMERDALIAHGSGSLLHDRLFWCSDASMQYVCCHCRDILSLVYKPQDLQFPSKGGLGASTDWTCNVCGSGDSVALIDIPYVYRYLCSELAAMNIKTDLQIGDFS